MNSNYKILEEIVHISAKLINQYIFKNKLTFLVLFNAFGEDNERMSDIELPNTLGYTRNLTQSELDNINFQWILENTIQSIEMKESRWNFQRINTMSTSF